MKRHVKVLGITAVVACAIASGVCVGGPFYGFGQTAWTIREEIVVPAGQIRTYTLPCEASVTLTSKNWLRDMIEVRVGENSYWLGGYRQSLYLGQLPAYTVIVFDNTGGNWLSFTVGITCVVSM